MDLLPGETHDMSEVSGRMSLFVDNGDGPLIAHRGHSSRKEALKVPGVDLPLVFEQAFHWDGDWDGDLIYDFNTTEAVALGCSSSKSLFSGMTR